MRWAQRSPVAYVGAGLTAVGLGLGIGFGIAANSAQSNADTLANKIRSTAASDPGLSEDRRARPCPESVTTVSYVKACDNLRKNLDAADSNRTVMTVGIVVGAVGVATIVGGYFLTAKKLDNASIGAPRWAVAPIIGPQVAGLGAAGSF